MKFDAMQYTVALLSWLIVLSIVLQIAAFYSTARGVRFSWIEYLRLPTVLIAPLVIVFGHKVFHWNFIAGIQSDMNSFDLILSTFAPAGVLVLASGLASRIFAATQLNYKTWQGLGFVKFARASGKSLQRELFRLTVTKSYAEAMFLSIPIIFAELVIVEALFNCYGIGYQTLSLMREEKFADAAQFFAVLVAMSIFCLALSWLATKRLGEKLESYC